jgi:hypothetical protein
LTGVDYITFEKMVVLIVISVQTSDPIKKISYD